MKTTSATSTHLDSRCGLTPSLLWRGGTAENPAGTNMLLSSGCPMPASRMPGRHSSLQQAQPRQQALVQQTRPPQACKHKAAACSAVQDTVEAAPQAWDGLADEKAALHVGAHRARTRSSALEGATTACLEHYVWYFRAHCKQLAVACSIAWFTGTLATLPRQRGSCGSS